MHVLLRTALTVLCLTLWLSLPACHKDEAGQPGAAVVAPTPSEDRGNPYARGQVEVSLSPAEKQALITAARTAFDTFVTSGRAVEPDPATLPQELAQKKGNMVFATIYHEGTWRGCMGGKGDTLVQSAVQAVLSTAQDRRFANPKPEELDGFRVELSVLQPYTALPGKDLETIGQVFKPGVHGLHMADGRYQGFFLPYVFVKQQRGLEEWLTRLSLKATDKKEKDLWRKPETIISYYRTINFIEDKPRGAAMDLYRYRVMLPGYDPALAAAARQAGEAYLLAQQGFAGGFLKPGAAGYESRPQDGMDPCQQAMAARAMAAMTDRPAMTDLARRLLAALDKELDPHSGLVMRDGGGEKQRVDVCATAHILMARGLLPAPDKATLARMDAAVAFFTKHADEVADAGATSASPSPGATLFVPQDTHDHGLGFVLETLSIAGRHSAKAKAAAQALFKSHAEGLKPAPQASLGLGLLAYGRLMSDTRAAALAAEAGRKGLALQCNANTAFFADEMGGVMAGNVAGLTKTARFLRLWSALSAEPGAGEDLVRQLPVAMGLAGRWLMEQQASDLRAFFFPHLGDYRGGFFKEGAGYTITPGLSAEALWALHTLAPLDASIAAAAGDNAAAFERSL